MSFWNSVKVQKSNKEHKCIYCKANIPKGSSCYHESGKTSEGFYDYRFCTRCHDFIEKFEVDLSDGFDVGDFFTELNYMSDSLFSCPNGSGHSIDLYDLSDDKLTASYSCEDCDTEFEVDVSFKPEPAKRLYTEQVRCSTCNSLCLFKLREVSSSHTEFACEQCGKVTNVLLP